MTYHAARAFADQRGISVVEVSVGEGVNVEFAFMTLVGEVLFKNPFYPLHNGI